MSRIDIDVIKEDPKNLLIADQLVEILQELIRIPSLSGCEEEIADYLERFGKKYPAWKVERDKIDNVYFVPKDCEDQELPLLMAHSDTFSKIDRALRTNHEIVNKYKKEDGLILNNYNTQLGYDDKCGIVIILWLIINHPNPKFRAIVAVQEERCNPPKGKKTIKGRGGGCGIQFALENKTNFFNSRWGLLLDRAEDKEDADSVKTLKIVNNIRQEKSDIIWKYNGKPICSKLFIDKLEEITDYVGTLMQKAASDAKCDAMNIREYQDIEKIAFVNLASGFYKEHDPDDYVSIFEVVRTLKIVEECLKRDKELSEIARAG